MRDGENGEGPTGHIEQVNTAQGGVTANINIIEEPSTPSCGTVKGDITQCGGRRQLWQGLGTCMGLVGLSKLSNGHPSHNRTRGRCQVPPGSRVGLS